MFVPSVAFVALALLLDASLLTPWFSTEVGGFANLVNGHPALILLPSMVALGSALGALLPPQLARA